MEYVSRGFEGRRLFDRRQNHTTNPLVERRTADRRVGEERREHSHWMSDWLRWRLYSLPIPVLASNNPNRKAVFSVLPSWAPLSLFALAFVVLVSTFNQEPVQFSPVATPDSVPSATESDSGAYMAGEVVIYDPSDDITQALVSEGYVVMETLNLKELGFVVQRLHVPTGVSTPEALRDLRYRYPNLDIDFNQTLGQIDPS